MRKFFTLILLLINLLTLTAQDIPLISRIIFIGDAGEIDPEQSKVIAHAAAQVLQGKTSVVYLGDNIYPKGMGLPGSEEERETQQILRSQFSPMRARGASVYFIPGNHDWDKSGPQGLAKIKAQSNFLRQQNDPNLKMVPADGCPGPVTITMADNLSIVAFDSEWWVFPHHQEQAATDCKCKSKADVVAQMQAFAAAHKDQVILLASHHPFQSYGSHGGHFTFMQHLFPLRDINKNLYLPLPIVGSIYPLIRRNFPDPEDLRNISYKNMITQVDAAFASVQNLTHVAGHDHGLQFIKRNNDIQIVSGSGTKTSRVIKGKHALFGKATPGYVVADFYADKRLEFKFYEEQVSGVSETFKFVKHYTALKD